MRGVLIIFMCLFLCGGFGRFEAWTTGKSELCVDGVKYIQFTSGASVKYNADGSIALCK